MPDTTPRIQRTNKDFESIRSDLVSKISHLSSSWTNLNEGDLGMVLLNMVAGVADQLHYYLDRNTEEVLLPLARSRESVRRIVALIDYRLSRPVAARTTLRFSLEEPLERSVSIPAYTQVRTRQGIHFVTRDEAVLYAGSTQVEVEALQGNFVTDSFSGDGSRSQSYLLSRPNVAQNFLEVRVNGELWTEDSPDVSVSKVGVYEVHSDANEAASLVFSRHLGGVPGQSATIEARYLETLGAEGNLGSDMVTVLASTFADSSLLSVTNVDPATGGRARESAESARIRAPKMLRPGGRAVTLQDFEDLLDVQDGVAKTKAVNHRGYVELFVAPEKETYLYVELPEFDLTAEANAQSSLPAGEYVVAVTAADAYGETAYWEWRHVPGDGPGEGVRERADNVKPVTVGAGEEVEVEIHPSAEATHYRIYIGEVGETPRLAGTVEADGESPVVFKINDLPEPGEPTLRERDNSGPRSADGYLPLKRVCEDMLEERRVLGTVFALYNPRYVSVNVTAHVRVYDNYRQNDVQGKVEEALREFFRFENQGFGQDVTLSDLYQAVMDVAGVRSVRFTVPEDDVEIGNGLIARAGDILVTAEGGVL